MTDEAAEQEAHPTPGAPVEPAQRLRHPRAMTRAQRIIVSVALGAIAVTSLRAPYVYYEIEHSAKGERRSVRDAHGPLWASPEPTVREVPLGHSRRTTTPELDRRRLGVWWIDILVATGISLWLARPKRAGDDDEPSTA